MNGNSETIISNNKIEDSTQHLTKNIFSWVINIFIFLYDLLNFLIYGLKFLNIRFHLKITNNVKSA